MVIPLAKDSDHLIILLHQATFVLVVHQNI
jgi:hypothetical protein